MGCVSIVIRKHLQCATKIYILTQTESTRDGGMSLFSVSNFNNGLLWKSMVRNIHVACH